MAQDFAKRKQSARTRRSPARKEPARRHQGESQSRGKGLRLYLGGVVTGVFLSFMGYLTTLSNPSPPLQATGGSSQPETEILKPRFDFYTLLPTQTIDVDEKSDEVEPAADVSKPPSADNLPEVYLLQAGSFRQKEDAERRRAELLLLGLEPNIEGTSGDNGHWFRVYLGPFASHKNMTRARSLTANQNIDTLILKRGRP